MTTTLGDHESVPTRTVLLLYATLGPVTLIRAYWSVMPLAAFAFVMLVLGAFTTNEFSVAGWGFAGGAIVRAVDVAQERSRTRTD
jgi:hypothetical protein